MNLEGFRASGCDVVGLSGLCPDKSRLGFPGRRFRHGEPLRYMCWELRPWGVRVRHSQPLGCTSFKISVYGFRVRHGEPLGLTL